MTKSDGVTANFLGSDPGDEGEIVVDNGYLYGYYSNAPRDDWTIGGNGGNGRFVVERKNARRN